MSSLRLALKQSLQETGHMVPDGVDKKKRRIKMLRKNAVTKRGARPGEPPKIKRKRGRPRKYPRPEDLIEQGELTEIVTVGASAAMHKEGQGESDKPHQTGDGESSSENEFSYDEEEEDGDSHGHYEEDDEEEEEDHDEDDEEEDEDDEDDDMHSEEEHESTASHGLHKASSSGDHHPASSHKSHADAQPPRPDRSHPSTEDSSSLDDEIVKHRKLLKKKLKHSAANKIQNQWKKTKNVAIPPTGMGSESRTSKSDPELHALKSSDQEERAGSESKERSKISNETSAKSSGDTHGTPVGKKKKKKVAGLVPPPTADVLEWAHSLSEKKCRKGMCPGLRVKVRFATKVKRDGKRVKKKIWYGGRVVAVSTKGSKIKIKYDDGTSEISKFPDADVVVDAVMNGQHSKPADRFLPPNLRKTELEPIEESQENPASGSMQSSSKEEQEVVPEVLKPPVLHVDIRESDSQSFEGTTQDRDHVSFVEESEPKLVPRTPLSSFSSSGNTADSIVVPDPSDACGMASVESREEGELSPGFTTQRRDVADVLQMELVPVPQGESEKSVEGVSTADHVGKGIQHQQDPPNEEEGSSTATKTELRIRIPAFASTKGRSSPKSSPSVAKNEVSVDDILVDTPVSQDKTKRKREDGGEDEPPKRKIKITIEKIRSKPPPETSAVQIAGLEDGTLSMVTKESFAEVEPNHRSTDHKLPQEQPAEATEMNLQMDLAPTQYTEKRKKKKPESFRSPGPRSPVPQRVASPTKMINQESEDSSPLDPSQMGSKSSDLPGIKPATKISVSGDHVDIGLSEVATKPPSLKSVASLDSLGSASRGGRKAAHQAKEKLSAKEKDKEKESAPLEPNKKKKKRRRMEETDGEEAEDLSKETEWVQCDSCGKWRILPSDVKVSSLPNLWYCHMNMYDPKRSTCDAPEQTAKQALKERKRAKKRAKRLEAESQQVEAKKEKQQPITPVSSPKPTKGVKSGGKLKDHNDPKKKLIAVIGEEQGHPSDSGSESHKEEKKKAKTTKMHEIASTVEDMEPVTEVKKPVRKRGRPARNQTITTPQTSSRENQDEDNVEWVQCEKCEKWRKLPPDISADELPDTWYCSMNTWNSLSASCEAAEDKTDSQHHEIGSSEWQLRQTHAGKYSYRQMIFGTGARKQNRPMSERSRAAESLFVKPVSDEESHIPTTQYSKTSSFLPRTSNFNKAHMVEERGIGIFDVLSNSKLWAELRAMEQTKPMKVGSSSASGSIYPKFATYENLPDEIKSGMQEVVLQILGHSALEGEMVIQEARQYPWDDEGMIRYCNADVIINTLLALVRDGIVEMATSRDRNIPISQWIPKYRRVKSERALAAEEAIKASKCMKIAKPWKQREENVSEWVSGQDAFY